MMKSRSWQISEQKVVKHRPSKLAYQCINLTSSMYDLQLPLHKSHNILHTCANNRLIVLGGCGWGGGGVCVLQNSILWDSVLADHGVWQGVLQLRLKHVGSRLPSNCWRAS